MVAKLTVQDNADLIKVFVQTVVLQMIQSFNSVLLTRLNDPLKVHGSKVSLFPGGSDSEPLTSIKVFRLT